MQEAPKTYNYDHQESNFFENLWQKYVPYWPLYLLLTGMAVSATYFYLKYQLPVYQASATLLIKDEMRGSYESEMLKQIDGLSSSKLVENEIEVLKSRRLAKEVVKNIHLYAPVMLPCIAKDG
jgi:tyrosine-protein kinase Etk/Wzc